MHFDPSAFLSQLSHILVAYLLALPIGWSQEKESRSAGIRTFPLVAIGACSFMLIGIGEVESPAARAQIAYGIITGIGFIGGGAILKEGGSVRGTATAASLWNTGAIGMAVAWGRLDIALTLSVVNFVTLYFVNPLRKRLIQEAENEENGEKPGSP